MTSDTPPLWAWSAHDLSQALAKRQLTSSDLVATCLARIEQHNSHLRAFVDTYTDTARQAAHASDEAIQAGRPASPWQGIPIALKDVMHIEGRVTTAGSRLWAQRRAEHTAPLVQRLTDAGLVLLGKTHAVEFALGGWGTNAHMGTPWNPWDAATHRIPGGSSSGSAVAVAAGLVPWSLGTDTGGSIRMPAAYCGLTGFKPTVGRISTDGVVPLSATMDTVGPLARTVYDCAALYTVLQPPAIDADGAVSAAGLAQRLHADLRGMRLGCMPDAERAGTAPAVLHAYDEALHVLAGLGATLETVSLPSLFEDYNRHNATIVATEAYAVFGALARDRSNIMDPMVRDWILTGATLSPEHYHAALRARDEDMARFAQATSAYDAILTPTTEDTAMPVADVDFSKKLSRYTRVGNYLDLCALALPNGADSHGLPTSLQIMCRHNDEWTALRIGHAYQQATTWHLRRAPGY